MDVRCERCGTEYEFEDEKVTEEGVTVKCSTCGHLFKIRKKSFVLTEPVVLGKKDNEDESRLWMVRKTDGTILKFKELTTLQKWIVERKVTREDEISKSGETWKKLGSIAELSSFFLVVDQAVAAQSGQIPAPQPPPHSPGGGHVTQPLPAAQPFPSGQQQAAAPGVQTSPPQTAVPPAVQPEAAVGATPSPAVSPTSVPPSPAQASAGSQAVEWQQQPAAGAQVAQQQPGVAQPEPQPSYEQQFLQGTQVEPDSWGDGSSADEDDVIEKWKSHRRRKWYFIIPVLVILVGMVVFYVGWPKEFKRIVASITGAGVVPDAARKQFEQAVQAFERAMPEDYTKARSLLEKALSSVEGKWADALAAEAMVLAEMADEKRYAINELDDRIELLQKKENELKPQDGSEPRGKLYEQIAAVHNEKVELQKQRLVLVDESKKLLEEAKRLIDEGRKLEPENLMVAVARARYQSVMGGNAADVVDGLKKFEKKGNQDAWYNYAVGAALLEDTARMNEAEPYLRKALELRPAFVQARVRLGLLLLRSGRKDAAAAELKRVLATSPGQQLAKMLMDGLEKPEPEKQQQEKEERKPEQEPEQKPQDYRKLLVMANRLQENGASRKALALYDRVLEIKPGLAAALAGKGWCYVDMGSFRMAANWFRQALRADPRNPSALIGIAEAYKSLGDKAQAIKYYERYLQLHPNGDDAPVARRNLEELK